VDTFFGGDLTKPAITIASVARFYLNLVICLQLEIALLIQNTVKKNLTLFAGVMTMYTGV